MRTTASRCADMTPPCGNHVGVEQPDGGYWMPLFVDLVDGAELTDLVVERIRSAIRTRLSPRHVPDEVFEVPPFPARSPGNVWRSPSNGYFREFPSSR